MATGVTMTELRVTGESGGTSTSFGRRSPAPGQSHFIAPTAPAPAITTTISVADDDPAQWPLHAESSFLRVSVELI
jgi:hypothetical protein